MQEEIETIYGFINGIEIDFPKKVVVIGAGGFGRECAEVCKRQYLHSRDVELVGFLDENENLHGKYFDGVKVLGGFNWIHKVNYQPYFVVGIGDPKIREALTKRAIGLGYKPITLIDPTAVISTGVRIGKGVVILPSVNLAIGCIIKAHVHINYNAVIGHFTEIGEYTTIAPSANIVGDVKVGKNCYIGTNATVLQGLSISKDTTIGAQACVVKDIEIPGIYVGIPAKRLN